MSYKHRFISNLKQLDQERIEELDKLLQKETPKCSKVFEVGTYAGYVTLMLGGYIADVTTIDYDQFVSPDIDEHKKLNRLSRPADQRKALLRGLTTEVIRHGRIRTTLVRAKVLRSEVDHMITLAKKGSLHHRRQALSYLYDKDLVASLLCPDEIEMDM
mgnify:CR=1 FL=1